MYYGRVIDLDKNGHFLERPLSPLYSFMILNANYTTIFGVAQKPLKIITLIFGPHTIFTLCFQKYVFCNVVLVLEGNLGKAFGNTPKTLLALVLPVTPVICIFVF